MIEIVIAKAEHVPIIAKNMRAEDRAEIKRFNPRVTPVRSLNQCFRQAIVAWTALKEGVPIAMFGACEINSWIDDNGVVFFLGTDEVRKHPRELLTYAAFYIDAMLDLFTRLNNRIDPNNSLAVGYAKKLLKRLPNNVRLTESPLGLDIEFVRGEHV